MKRTAKKWLAAALLLLCPLMCMPALSSAEGVDVFSARLQYMAGIKYFQSGDFENAAAAFEEIVEKVGAYQEEKLYLAYIQAQRALDRGDLSAALSGFEALSAIRFLDAGEKANQVALQMEERQAVPEADHEAAPEKAEPEEAPQPEVMPEPEPTPAPTPQGEKPPFENVRVTVVTPARVEVEWDAPAQLWALVEVWHQGNKMLTRNVSSGKAVFDVPPETELTVTVTSGDYTEAVVCQTPGVKNYREHGYKRTESYTAYVLDINQDFYKQTRKSQRSITREELLDNLENGYAYGTHVNFTWKRTQEEKVLTDLILITRTPDGRYFVDETSPMTIPGNWTNAFVMIQINKSLLHFLNEEDFVYGKYEFVIYTQGQELGHSALTIDE